MDVVSPFLKIFLTKLFCHALGDISRLLTDVKMASRLIERAREKAREIEL
jgi:hypothetical protein